jgi:hypothetical protein
LIEAYATLEEPDMEGAERILVQMEESGIEIGAVHHSAMNPSRRKIHDYPG